MSKSKDFFQKCGKVIGGFFFKYRYLWRSLGVAFITLIMTIFLLFFLLRLIPGSSVDLYAQTLASQRNIPFDEARELAIIILGYDTSHTRPCC